MNEQDNRAQVIRIMQRVWQEIGADVLANCAYDQFGWNINPLDPAPGYGGCTYAELATANGEEVRDIIADYVYDRKEEPAIVWYLDLPYEERKLIREEAFPNKKYGY